jgi:hypothetical protein
MVKKSAIRPNDFFGSSLVPALWSGGRRLKSALFFVAQTRRIFAESLEIRFERAPAPTSPPPAPFKKFSKK